MSEQPVPVCQRCGEPSPYAPQSWPDGICASCFWSDDERGGADEVRATFIDALNRHSKAVELGRQIIANPNEYGENVMARALVDLDELARSLSTDV